MGGPNKGGGGVWKMPSVKSGNLPSPAIANLYKTKKFYITLYWLPKLKSMEFAWDISNVTFEWFKHLNELK